MMNARRIDARKTSGYELNLLTDARIKNIGMSVYSEE